MEEKLKVTVSGRVQGIGYRAFVAYYAKLLGIKGYVKNLPDGRRVEAVLVGDEKAVEKLIWIMKNKHPLAVVESIKIEDYRGKEEFKDFEVLK